MVTFHTASVGSRPPNWVPSVWFAPLVFGRRDGISLPQKATGTARRGSHMVASAGAAENDPRLYRFKVLNLLVRVGRLELPRPLEQQILSLPRLPFRHTRFAAGL